MKKKAIKIAASTAVAASAFVAAAPAQQADAATNVNQLATNAQNAGTVLKWAISYEGSADFKSRPFDEFNAAKKAVATAEAAAAKLSATEKLNVQAKLVDAKVQIVRATAYIDAITSSEKIKALTSNLNAAIATGDLGKVETAYHAASFEYKKQAKLLDRVYGQSTRDGIRNAVKPAMEAALDAVKYDVTVKMHLDKASALIKEGKLEEAAAELAKADYNLTLKDAKFTFKTQLQKSYDDVAVSLPLQAVSAVGDGNNTVTVKFSKAYDKLTTFEAGQFKIAGLTVQSAKLADDKKSVVLTTSKQSAGKEYTVTWQGKSVKFTTPAVGDTSGIAVNQTDVAYLETTQTRPYEVTITNADGTTYVGDVEVKLATTTGSAVVTSVNGVNKNTATVTARTDVNGKLYFSVGSTSKTASALKVVPTVTKLDGTTGKKDKVLAASYFYQLQETDSNVGNTGFIETRGVASKIDSTNDYIFVKQNDKKYKWDSNDLFFIAGASVSQETFEKELSRGDSITIDYKAKADERSSFSIVNNQTLAEGVVFTNPANEDVRFDGSNYDLSGTGDAGYTVKIYKDTKHVGSTVVASDGTWTLRAVNLSQNALNTFDAFLLPAGKDVTNPYASNTVVESTDTVKIYEGAFASKGITLNDQGDAGLSVGDTLDFTFFNNDKSFGHEFKEDLEGTITVHDNLSRKAVYDVEYVDVNTLKVVKVVSSETGYQPNSKTTIESTTGIVNQDELAYNVAVSKATGNSNVIGSGVANTTGGAVTYINGGTIEVGNGTVYTVNANTSIKYLGKTIALGTSEATAMIGTGKEIDLGDSVKIDGNVITVLTSVKLEADAAASQAKIVAVKTKANAGTLVTGDLAAVTGLTHTVANVAAYQTAIAAKTAADVDTVAELQAVINKVDADLVAAALQGKIDAVKAKANAGTLVTGDLVAVTGLTHTVANVAAYQTAIAAKATVDVDTVAELQAVIDKVDADILKVAEVAKYTTAGSSTAVKALLDAAADGSSNPLALNMVRYNGLNSTQKNKLSVDMEAIKATLTTVEAIQEAINSL